MDESAEKLPFNATKLFEALQYQLMVALEYCYKLKRQQRLWVELYGDVTLEGEAQVEVKFYADELTDSHHNIWNTLNNWLHQKFDYTAYQRLVLMTNQDFSSKSTLRHWNSSTADERYSLLRTIYNAAETKFAKKVSKATADREAGELLKDDTSGRKNKKIEPSETLAIQRKVMDATRHEDLMGVLARTEFITNSASLKERIENFKVERLKVIRESKHQIFLDDLLGFIGSTRFIAAGWEITCEAFSSKLSSLTKQYMKHSNAFPVVDLEALRNGVDLNEISHRPFVKKIQEIGADHRIRRAAYHMLVAGAVIDELYKDSLAFESDIKRYQRNHLERHLDGRERAMRNCRGVSCPVKLNDASLDFYLDRHDMSVLQLCAFEDTTVEFRNGIYHMLADALPEDTDEEFLWRLWP